ncbi:MAG: BolA family protein [Burkholderiales bacterium]|nr:BolA family protein [Burkholderiales bacterium]
MNVRAEIERRLAALAPERLELEDESERHAGHAGARPGGQTHWRLTIVAAAFAGKPILARHRMVYAALGDLLQSPIHALAIRALAPDEPGARAARETGA